MVNKNRVKVTIQGKTITLTGTESEQYILQVAQYIDEKVASLKKNSPQIAMDASLHYVLTSVNVADDYFKELEKNILLNKKNEKLKLELSGSRPKSEVERLYKQLDEIKQELSTSLQENELLRQEIIALETEKEQMQTEVEQYRINTSRLKDNKDISNVIPRNTGHIGAHKNNKNKPR